MTVLGLLRVRNESKWIVATLRAILPLCERVYVFDDASSDGTAELAEQLDQRVTVIRTPFRTPRNGDDLMDEARDKGFALSRLCGAVSDIHLRGNPKSPFWCLAIDADEVLEASGPDAIRNAIADTPFHAFSLPIPFLWDSDLSLIAHPGQRRVRVDGVYTSNFITRGRPSLFRLFNSAFGYQKTPFGNGANFHCSSIPQELLGHAFSRISGARLWHEGYCHKADRIRKFAWYSKVDGNNEAEGRYLHMISGDGPVEAEGFPAGFEVPLDAKLRHAGPFAVEMM